MKKNNLSVENINFKQQQINRLKNQLEQKDNKIKDLEDEIKDLKDQIKRYPFILGKNEYLMAIIFISLDQKVHHPMICKNTDTINEIEKKLYEKYPDLPKKENYFLCKGNNLNKFESLEKNNIKEGDIIFMNNNDSSRLSK